MYNKIYSKLYNNYDIHDKNFDFCNISAIIVAPSRFLSCPVSHRNSPLKHRNQNA